MSADHAVKQLLQPHLDGGLELWLEGEALRFKAPKELMTPDLVAILKANKSDILQWLQAEAAQSAESQQPELVDEYPLAYTQGAIWMLYKFAPNSPAYNTTFACTLATNMDETAVRQAFHALLVRHPVLRSTFTDTEHGPRQRVWNHIAMPLQIVDGSGWDETELQRQLDQEADAPFDLHTEPCLRVKIIKNSIQGDILIATIQHVGADLWALLVVAQDIKTFYEKAARGEPLSVQPAAATYRQHVEWQQSFMDSARGKKERFYWKQQLNGAPLAISLPEDRPRPPVLQLQAKTLKHQVAKDQYQAIKQFCKQNSITPFVFVQAAFQLLVHHRTSAQDFLVGTPTMGRSRKGMEEVVGDFANPVVLRARVQPGQRLSELFTGVKKTLLAAMEHQECPFPIVVQDCNPPRDSSRTPLFQLMFVWHQGNADMMPKDGFIKDVLPMSGPRGAPYDVMLAVSDLGDHFELNWTYQTSLYEADTVNGFAEEVNQWMACLLQAESGQTIEDLLRSTACEDGEDGLKAQEAALNQSILNDAPALQNLCYRSLLDVDSQGKPFRRLFVECDDATGQKLLPAVRDSYDDVVFVPRFARSDDGNVDLWALRQYSNLNQTLLRKQLSQQGLSEDALIVARRRRLLPTYSADELAAEPDAGKLLAPNPGVDLAQRADAWMRGGNFTPTADAPRHLFDALRRTASRFPEKGFLFVSSQGEEFHYPYARLEQDAYRAAFGIQQAGLNEGDILLLQMRFDRRFFAVWWGALLIGARPLVVATPEHYHERNGVAQKLYNVSHNFDRLVVAADQERVEDTRRWLGESKPVVDADALLNHDQTYIPEQLGDDPVAFLQLTSGSTGTPKAIQITHRGVLHHIASSAQFNGYDNRDVSLNWLPFDHVVPILTTHLKDIVLGIQQVQLQTAAVLSDPMVWLRALSHYRVTYSWAPNFAYQRVIDALKNQPDLSGLDLSCVKILMNAGEQVLAPVVSGFTAALQPYGLPADAVQPAFGMAEACTCMTYNNQSSTQLSVHFRPTSDLAVVDVVPPAGASHGFVDLGPVIPGVEVRITNDQNELVKEGVIGRMQIRGPVITPGYLNNPDANAEAFVGDGWFNSGDLGFIWNQRLILTGREKEMIVVNGANFYCFELELVAAKVSGVLPTFVAATGVTLKQGENSDALVLFYVSDGDADVATLERQMIARVAESFGVVARYVIAVEQEDFYKTTSGKIQRGQFKKLFESGFYREQVEAYERRHRAARQLVDTVFSLDQVVERCDDRVQKPFEVIAVGELGAQLEQMPATTTAMLVDMGLIASDLQSAAEASFRFAQALAQVRQSIKAASVLDLCLWVQAGDRSVMRWIKPLVDTLRQETGQAALSCLVSSADESLLLPRPGDTVWQEGQRHYHDYLGSVAQSPVPNDAIVRRGVYVVTGGLGGLAEPLCDYLINDRKACVVLTGRGALQDDRRRQSRFNQLRARFGADTLHYLCIPDWNAENIHDAVEQGLQVLGRNQLDGVFHLAGHMAMLPLENITRAHWDEVVQSKAASALALARYLQAYWPRSILVQYGSLNSYFGGQAAAAYSAANAIQAAVTDELNRAGTVRSWCLNWSVWQGTGMAAQFTAAELQMARNKGFLSLDAQQDSRLIPRLLQLPPASYFIGLDPAHEEVLTKVDMTAGRSIEEIELFVDGSECTQPERIRSAMHQLHSSLMPHAHTPQWQVHITDTAFERDEAGLVLLDRLRQQLASGEEQGEAASNDLEQAMADIWSDVLGRPVTDVARSFFEYGGHSINATQVVAAINNKMGLPITVANLFQYPTIRELAGMAESAEADNRLSLTLSDCITRADDYHLDLIDPELHTDVRLVYLPTALGLPAAYGQMAANLSGYQSYVACMPAADGNHADLAAAATRFIDLLEKAGLANSRTVLIGWSMAGVLGYEIIHQLSKDYSELPRLIMLDSGFADGLHEITFDEVFQQLMFAVELGLSMDKYADFNQQEGINKKLHWLQQYLATIGIEVSEEMLIEWWKAYFKRLKCLLTYQLSGELVDADINLFKAAQHTHGRADLGWTDNNNGIKWTSIQADHQGIVKQPETFQRIREQLA